MPRRRPPHLHREITRHGKAVWYVRVGRGPRVRIRADYGTPEFDAEYRAARSGTPSRKAAPSQSSLKWLLALYRETTAWTDLSAATRRQRDNIFKQVIETAGHEPYAKITTATIEAGKERLRPILMTTIAMIAGMLPIALASGDGAEVKNGMAWVIIGGLTSSLLLTLFLVPSAYYVVDRIKERFARRKKRKNREELVLEG